MYKFNKSSDAWLQIYSNKSFLLAKYTKTFFGLSSVRFYSNTLSDLFLLFYQRNQKAKILFNFSIGMRIIFILNLVIFLQIQSWFRDGFGFTYLKLEISRLILLSCELTIKESRIYQHALDWSFQSLGTFI